MQEINFTPFPALTTERLTLRQLIDTDEDAIFQLRSDKMVNKYIDRPMQTNIAEARAFMVMINDGIELNKWVYWAICLKDNPGLIGTACLWNISPDKTTAELGYELNPAFQGEGFMDEALKCIIRYSFQNTGITALEAFTHKDNDSSRRLLEKNNFTLEKERKDEQNSNNIIFTLSREN